MDDGRGSQTAGAEGRSVGASAGDDGTVERGAGGRRPLPSEEDLLEAAREAHRRRPGPMTLGEFERLTGFKSWQVSRVMAGGWTELREGAGIPLHPRELKRWSEEELLAEFHRVGCAVGRLARWSDIKRLGRVSETPFHNRFGRKAELVRRYRAWLEAHEPESPFLGQIEAARRRTGASGGSGSAEGRGRGKEARWRGRPAVAGPVYGEELNFRGLGYAPTNEKGVLVLFGMLAEDLGYRVDAVGPGFPDCEAMRALDAGRTQWQRVRIEFEHRSRNFRDHGHDPAGCDVVVCWKHDWAECPVEVVELSAEVRRLRAEGGGQAGVRQDEDRSSASIEMNDLAARISRNGGNR